MYDFMDEGDCQRGEVPDGEGAKAVPRVEDGLRKQVEDAAEIGVRSGICIQLSDMAKWVSYAIFYTNVQETRTSYRPSTSPAPEPISEPCPETCHP